ncbi:MAG TPA: hypothetical protein VGU73_03685 [Acidimicrobiia bacterium]|nr:hypothetical protein [Acidimicrobiia bacterium]
MPVPFPSADTPELGPPDAAEVSVLTRGIVSASSPPQGLTQLQRTLVSATAREMTGFDVDDDPAPIDPRAFAEAMAGRTEAFRIRIVQLMVLNALVLRPIPPTVAAQVRAFARELGVDEGMLRITEEFAAGTLGLAAVDFDRNGYTSDWSAEHQASLHTSTPLESAWDESSNDPTLARQWCELETLPPGTLGRRITEFYRARGFIYPGHPGSAPPLLAQHDWVHVLADYGTCVESELEVFSFIARANDDPRAFSLLAMVVSLFETGYLAKGAGLFEASPGQLSHEGVADRMADAMRRGALVDGSVDFLELDWFDLADQPVEEVRRHFGIVEKHIRAVGAGSVGPWEPGGISPFQWKCGQERARAAGAPYEPFGASLG